MSLNLATTGGTAGGFDHLGPGPHDLVVDLHAPAGWAVIGGTAGTPWSLASQTTSKLTYQALGVHAEDVYGCEFEVELTDNSYGWAYGYAVVTDVDLDLPDGADDDTESTVPHPLPITIPGDTFPAGDPALLGHQPATSLWYGIDAPTAYTTVPGQLEFHVFGPGVALYRLNGSTYEYEPLTAPITASHVGDISEEIVVYTNDLFTGEATIEARLSHDNGPTDSADVVLLAPAAAADPFKILRMEDGGDGMWHELDDALVADPGRTMRNALPGQLIKLKSDYTPPAGKTVDTWQWGMQGKYFKDWDPNSEEGELEGIAPDDLDESVVQFYWADPGEHTVGLQITLSDGTKVTHTENLTVEELTCTLTGAIGKTAAGENSEVKQGEDWPAFGLFSTGGQRATNGQPPGVPNPGGTPSLAGDGRGVVLSGNVSLPAGWPTGKWHFLQLVTPDRFINDQNLGIYTRARADVAPTEANGTEHLDSSYPFKDKTFDTSSGTKQVGDAPQELFKTLGPINAVAVGNERFRTWIQVLPPGPNSRYVPCKVVSWQWGGVANVQNGQFATTVSMHQHIGTASTTSIHPGWSTNITMFKLPLGNPTAQIAVDLTQLNASEGTTITGTVTLPNAVTAKRTISLSTSNPSRATVPASVDINVGQTFANFTVTVSDNDEADGDVDVIVFGQATPGFLTGTKQFEVQDNDD